MPGSAIKVKHLKKYYEVTPKSESFSIKNFIFRPKTTIKAVDDISFKIKEGELVGFIGPNGAGKTTTLKTLSGLLYPTSGQISVLGLKPYRRQPKLQKQFSLIMGQKSQLIWDLPPLDTFILNRDIYDIPRTDFDTTLNELSALLNVSDLLHQPVRKLSLGQRMKMELIAALIHSPKLLYLDEPTIGLDVVAQETMRQFIKDYNLKHQATILLTSHYMEDVQKLCQRVIIIDQGKLIYDGKIDHLINQHLPDKFVKFTTQAAIDRQRLSQLGRVIKFDPPNYVLAIPRDQAVSNSALIIRRFAIDDLNIEEPQLEVVVRQIFKQNHE